MDPALADLLSRARSGGIHGFGDQGPEGSAEWCEGQPLPATLLLHDLRAGSLPEGFGAHPSFASVTELDLSGNVLQALPSDVWASMGSMRVLFLGGPGPKFTPEGASCNVLEALPPLLGSMPHLEHLSLHDNSLTALPELISCTKLHTLRLDRNPLRALPDLPPSLRVLHLEGCPLGGTLERPGALPAQVRALSQLEDLQLPDGSHVGEFFGAPLRELLAATAEGGGGHAALQASLASPDASDEATHAAIHEIFESGGITATCFSGLDKDELAFVNRGDHGGEAAHVYGDTDVRLVTELFELLRGAPASGTDAFFDLGSGDAKLTLSMVLLTPVRVATGIELSPTRHQQALAAQEQARARGLLGIEREARLRLICGNMLAKEHGLAEATLVFCYSLCLDDPFLRQLRAFLARQLPVGAAVLLRGRPLPAVADAGERPADDEPGSDRACRLELALQTFIINRQHQYYGYRVVAAGSDATAAPTPEAVRYVELEVRACRFGETFVTPASDAAAVQLWSLFEEGRT